MSQGEKDIKLPHCVVLLQDWEFVGRSARNRPIKRLVKSDSVGTWHPISSCFVFAHDRGWNPFFWWRELQAAPERWKALGYDSNADGDCAYCARSNKVLSQLEKC